MSLLFRLMKLLPVSVLICACAPHKTTTSATAPMDCALYSDGGKVGPGTVELLATLGKVRLADPVADLDANISLGDKRFIGINSYSCSEPGLAAADVPFLDRFHANCLAGTGDIIERKLHSALVDAAAKYARIYNTELL
jgi:hypothetical protein